MSRRLRFVVAGLGLVVIIAAAWFLLFAPLREDIAAVSTSIEQEKDKLAAATAKLAQAETTRAEGKENQARLLELAKMVPYSEEIPSLMLQIQDLADQSGIEFTSVAPGQPMIQQGYQIIPLSLQFTGTYFDMSDFVYRAEQLVAGPGRLLAVKQIDLQLGGAAEAEGDSISPFLSVGVVLYAFQTGGDPLTAAAVPVESAPDEGADSDVTTTGGNQDGS